MASLIELAPQCEMKALTCGCANTAACGTQGSTRTCSENPATTNTSGSPATRIRQGPSFMASNKRLATPTTMEPVLIMDPKLTYTIGVSAPSHQVFRPFETNASCCLRIPRWPSNGSTGPTMRQSSGIETSPRSSAKSVCAFGCGTAPRFFLTALYGGSSERLPGQNSGLSPRRNQSCVGYNAREGTPQLLQCCPIHEYTCAASKMTSATSLSRTRIFRRTSASRVP
mmetsp:Transcript_112437/g.223422  ORF Transcript_112437/g.223422 Transcript_112437/m.223422 type:complete len:227 (+) Transcript_112437:213-893(+)